MPYRERSRHPQICASAFVNLDKWTISNSLHVIHALINTGMTIRLMPSQYPMLLDRFAPVSVIQFL